MKRTISEDMAALAGGGDAAAGVVPEAARRPLTTKSKTEARGSSSTRMIDPAITPGSVPGGAVSPD